MNNKWEKTYKRLCYSSRPKALDPADTLHIVFIITTVVLKCWKKIMAWLWWTVAKCSRSLTKLNQSAEGIGGVTDLKGIVQFLVPQNSN